MICIIGGAGFVGQRLCKILAERGIAYKALDITFSGDNYIDITNRQTFDALSGATIIINLAAEHRDDVSPKSLYHLVNVQGSKNLCSYAEENNIKKIVFTSSVAVYGFAPEGTDECGQISYFNEYGRTKFLAEEVYREWFQKGSGDVNLIIIRPTVIFGEGNRGNVFNLLNQIASKRFIMFGNGRNRKSMAYVQNVAECIAHVTNLSGYHLYNYTDQPDLDMNTLIGICRTALFQKEGVGLRLPARLGLLAGHVFDFLAIILKRKLPISSIRVKKFLGTTAFSTSVGSTGFTPSTTLKQGLEKTLQFEFLDGGT